MQHPCPRNGRWTCPTQRGILLSQSVPILLPAPAPARSPARPPALLTPSSPKDTHHNPCPSCWSPPAARETFCYLQDRAKSPFRLKIPCDWTRFGGHPRQTERNPGQAPAARAAGSCQPAHPGLRVQMRGTRHWAPHFSTTPTNSRDAVGTLGQSQHLAPGGSSPSHSWAQGPRGPERWAMRLNSLFPMSGVESVRENRGIGSFELM